MIIHSTIVDCINALSTAPNSLLNLSSFTASRMKSQQVIANKVEDISASLPQVPGKLDSNGGVRKGHATALSGQSSLWPSNILQQMKRAPMTDRQWASDALLKIRQLTKIRRAWILATRKTETGEWHDSRIKRQLVLHI